MSDHSPHANEPAPREQDALDWLASQDPPKGSELWMTACALQAAIARFLALGAGVANLEARVVELERIKVEDAGVRADLESLRGGVNAVAERLARIEGIPPFIRHIPGDVPLDMRPGEVVFVDDLEEHIARTTVRRILGYHTSPLEREILTWYASRGHDYEGGSQFWKPVVVQAIDRFVKAGLLLEERRSGPNEPRRIQGNRPALRVYMEALASVPLPQQRWVTPIEEP